jgi:hypothetical protein
MFFNKAAPGQQVVLYDAWEVVEALRLNQVSIVLNFHKLFSARIQATRHDKFDMSDALHDVHSVAS